MSLLVSLDAVPNQELSVSLENFRYVLRFKDAGGVVVADVVRDGVTILEGTRVLAGEPLIPYDYLEGGNFVLITSDDELPAYEQFGVTQFLLYLTVAEISG